MLPLILAGAAAAVVALKKPAQKTGASASPVLPIAGGAPKPAQPSQKYPFQPVMPKRVDNANQPWYVGPAQAVAGAASSPGGQAALAAAGASVVHSMSDVWGSLSDMFGTNDSDPQQNLIAADAVSSDSSASIEEMPMSSEPDMMSPPESTDSAVFNDAGSSPDDTSGFDNMYDMWS